MQSPSDHERTGLSIFQALFISYLGIGFFIFILLAALFLWHEISDNQRESKMQMQHEMDIAVNYFDATYSKDIEEDLGYIDRAYSFNVFLSSPETEVLFTKSLAEQLFLNFTKEKTGNYLSVRFIDAQGKEQVVVSGNKRIKSYETLGPDDRDTFYAHLYILFQRIKSAKLGSILFEGPFKYKGKSTFLVGISKIDPEIGGFAGSVILHCDLTNYFNYLDRYVLSKEHEVEVFSPDNKLLFAPRYEGNVLFKNNKSPGIYVISHIVRIGSDNRGLFKINFGLYFDVLLANTALAFKYTFLVVTIIILPILGLLAFFVSEYFSKPLIKLADYVDRFAKGDLSIRVKINASGELGTLVRSFNNMAQELQKVTVSRDELLKEVEERKKIEVQIQRKVLESKLLFEITKMAAQTESLTDALHGCLSTICQLTSWPAGHIFIPSDNGTKELKSSKIWFIKQEEQDAFADFKKVTEESHFVSGVGLAGRVWESGEPVWIRDIQDDENSPRKDWCKGLIKGAFGFPIKVNNEMVAVAEFFTHEEISMDEDLAAFISSIGEQMSRVVERKRSEKEIQFIQAQVLQSEKLASIGQLAAGVAHEINNPVGFISNNMEVLQEYVGNYTKILQAMEGIKQQVEEGNLEKAKAALKELKKLEEEIDLEYMSNDIIKLLMHSTQGLERIRKIVLDLRTFARVDDAENVELIRIEEVMNGILSIVGNELKYKAELLKEYGETPLIRGNSSRLGQVFINLLVNAAQAIEEKGKIIIKTYYKNGLVYVAVSDTGKGIPEENLNKIFDPFFTTKPVGKGTGLGLSVCYEIIKKHGGEITVRSKMGEGSTFTVVLPVTGLTPDQSRRLLEERAGSATIF